ncbi:hypothetical protein ABT363_36420, partial [Streptomyces sp. NPDC000188]
MYTISLGDDGAELRPLETWHAEQFLAHLERGREFIGQHIGFGSNVKDVDSARDLLKSYADKRAADSGSLHGLWLDGTLVGGLLFRIFDAEGGNCDVVVGGGRDAFGGGVEDERRVRRERAEVVVEAA